MVKKVNIKMFLILSFALILLLMVGLGISSSYFTRMLANQTITFYDEPHTVQVEVAEVRRLMSDIGSLIRRAIIYQTPESDAYSQEAIQKDLDEMNSRITLVKEGFTGDEQILLTADATVATWIEEIDKLNKLMDENRYEEARVEFSTNYQTIEKEMNDNVLDISNYSLSVSKGYYEQAQRSKVISTWVITGIVVFSILLAILICTSIIKGITVPLKKVGDAAESMSKGNLHHQIDYAANNEFGQLVKSIMTTENILASYVDNIDHVLDQMSQNDLTVKLDMEYIGDFAQIRQSLKQILVSMNESMTQINRSSVQVTASAEQASNTATILSQGAAEQASSVEQLSLNLNNISKQVEQNAEYTVQTDDLVNTVVSEMEQGNSQMQQMVKAMADINYSSNQIAKIIKTIEDIAFQTNILALNAAVEAARAGTAGKGFAVVADEVRSLAAKSAEAAKSTTLMIQNSIQAVENGTRIADDTASTLNSVVNRAQDITQMISKISTSSEGQARDLSKINDVVTQIAHVIQSNSATSEESAAVSEEMKGQAQIMDSLIRKFKLLSKNE